jgi:hypothetical protein
VVSVLRKCVCAGNSPVKVQPEILDIFLGEVYVVYTNRGGGGERNVSLHVVNVTLTDLNPLAFILHF